MVVRQWILPCRVSLFIHVIVNFNASRQAEYRPSRDSVGIYDDIKELCCMVSKEARVVGSGARQRSDRRAQGANLAAR